MGWRLTVAVAAAAAAMLAQRRRPHPAPAPAPMARRRRRAISATPLPDTYKILPPAPVAGTTRYEADRTIFLGTRSLKDSPRWALAQSDVDQVGDPEGPDLRRGRRADRAERAQDHRPDRAASGATSAGATNRPKDIYKRQRPYLIDEGPICIDKSDLLAKSPDYPVGPQHLGLDRGPDHGRARARPGDRDPGPRPGVRREPAGLRRAQPERGGGRAAPTARSWWPPCTARRRSARTWRSPARRWPPPARPARRPTRPPAPKEAELVAKSPY